MKPTNVFVYTDDSQYLILTRNKKLYHYYHKDDNFVRIKVKKFSVMMYVGIGNWFFSVYFLDSLGNIFELPYGGGIPLLNEFRKLNIKLSIKPRVTDKFMLESEKFILHHYRNNKIYDYKLLVF